MALEVYWASGSPFSWRVLLTLEVKQLPYQSKLLTFSKREHKSPEYLALNPRGKVPTLKDGDFVLYESLAIMAYLDSAVPRATNLRKNTARDGYHLAAGLRRHLLRVRADRQGDWTIVFRGCFRKGV